MQKHTLKVLRSRTFLIKEQSMRNLHHALRATTRGSRLLRLGSLKTSSTNVLESMLALIVARSLDGVLTSGFKNRCLRSTPTIPGFDAKQAEDQKFYADRSSRSPVSIAHVGPHVLIPFAIEDGGCLGAHAQPFLLELARRVVAHASQNRGLRLDSRGGVAKGERATSVAMWVQLWQRKLFS